ncbi:uncharacterized protein LOC144440477 [Glandiceps talaboti]
MMPRDRATSICVGIAVFTLLQPHVTHSAPTPSERQLMGIILNVYEGSPFSITFKLSCKDFDNDDVVTVKVSQDDRSKYKHLAEAEYEMIRPSCHGKYCIDLKRDNSRNMLVTFYITNTTKSDDEGVYLMDIDLKESVDTSIVNTKCKGHEEGFSIQVLKSKDLTNGCKPKEKNKRHRESKSRRQKGRRRRRRRKDRQ